MAKMVAAASIVIRTLLVVLFCTMVASFVYLFIFGDYVACFDFHSRWLIQVAADFTTWVVVIGAWVAYKESSWIIAAVIMVTMYFLGSLVPIGYILTQFYKLSREESLEDPLYYVLARHQKRNATRGASVVVARVIFSVLGCLVLGVLIYTLTFELSASSKSFSSCILTNAIDIYIHVVILSVWIAYKESSWASALFWIALLICFRGVTICAYILCQLFYLSSQQPASVIIFKKDRDLHSSDPLLMEHPNV